MEMNLILGTMTFGQQAMDEAAAKMVKTALDNGIRELDTAYVYNEGECERILGRVLSGTDRDSLRIATKVNPRVTGKLDRASILTQFSESLDRLKVQWVDVLYLHFPDHLVPLEEILSTCNELYAQGKIRELGLSNYPASMVEEACTLCRNNGWLVPTVYEGVYNVLSRRCEGELFQVLRKHGLRFTAYNPLAGGLLTGKYTSVEDMPSGGRFVERATYKQRYWRESFFEAVKPLRAACEKAGIPMAEAALRWLAYHSELKADLGDAIILGASRPEQLIQNIQTVANGPLPADVAEVYDQAAAVCAEDAPAYYKFMN